MMQTTAWPPLWRGAGPLILASTSESRRALFSAAGLEAESVAPKVDERGLEDRYLAGAGSLRVRLGAGYAVGAGRLAGRATDPSFNAATLSGFWTAPYGFAGLAFAVRAAVAEANVSGSISSVEPFDRMTARSRMFSNSRTFPGQE